jgi:hypothetical protein
MADETWDGIYRDMLDEAADLREAVFLAIGAASACWTNLDGAGTFESTRAAELGDALIDQIRRRTGSTA